MESSSCRRFFVFHSPAQTSQNQVLQAFRPHCSSKRAPRNATNECRLFKQQMTHFETAYALKPDTLNRLATETVGSLLKNMTKVIFSRTDEKGGRKDAPPVESETPK